MAVTHQFNVEQVHVFPSKSNLTNVVGLVHWSVVFTDTVTTATSTGAGETLLGNPDPANFIPVESMTEEMLIAAVLAVEGGDRFLEQLRTIHAGQLAYNAKKVGMVPWTPAV
jgi:hypothetical protein